MVAPDRCLQVRDPGMVQLDESRVVRFEPIMPAKVDLHHLSGMMGSEDLGRKTPRGLPEKSIDVGGGDSVEDKILRLLVCHKFLEVSSYRIIGTIQFEGLLPSYAVLSQKVKLDASWKELNVLDTKRRGTNRISLVLLLLIADPHRQVVDKVGRS